MKKAIFRNAKVRSEKIDLFAATIAAVQRLVDIGLVKFNAAEREVKLNAFCISSLPDTASRHAYVRNLSFYYIIQYQDVNKVGLNDPLNPMQPDYTFQVKEHQTGKLLATYNHNDSIILH
jgi:hypothetical protein